MFSMAHALRLAGATMMVAGLIGCSPQRGPTSQLEQHRQQWQAQRITHYRYTFQQQCFCLVDATQPVKIEVRGDGQPSIVQGQDGNAANAALFASFDSIDKLFQHIAEAEANKPAELTVTYDKDRGFPTALTLDQSKQMADEEISYKVSEFEVLN